MYDILAVFFICAALSGCVKHRWSNIASIGACLTYLVVRILLTSSDPWIGPFALQKEYTNGRIDESTYLALIVFWSCALSTIIVVFLVLFVKFASLFVPMGNDAAAAVGKED